MRRSLISVGVGLALFLVPLSAVAQTPTEDKGLLITPLRELITLNAGSSKTANFTVANRTNSPLAVQLFDKQFSVANYSYAYEFNIPQPDLVTISKSEILLKPGESQKIPYTVSVPANTTPGGQYYTLFASATLTNGEKVTIQAASLLYVTVNGDLRKTTELQKASVQRFAFGNKITYELEPKNTGNVHYFIYVAGQLNGLSAKPAEAPVTHMLLPGTVRSVNGTISSPVLPGVYNAEYGYKTDSGQEIITSSYIVYLPPWSIAFMLLAALLLWNFISWRRKLKKIAHTSHEKPTE